VTVFFFLNIKACAVSDQFPLVSCRKSGLSSPFDDDAT